MIQLSPTASTALFEANLFLIYHLAWPWCTNCSVDLFLTPDMFNCSGSCSQDWACTGCFIDLSLPLMFQFNKPKTNTQLDILLIFRLIHLAKSWRHKSWRWISDRRLWISCREMDGWWSVSPIQTLIHVFFYVISVTVCVLGFLLTPFSWIKPCAVMLQPK